MQAIDIAFGFDGNYTPHAAAVIASVRRYAPDAAFRFIVLHEGVEAPAQRQVEALAPGSSFVWIEIGEDDVPAFEARRHLTRSTLYRLGLEKLAPSDCGRVLYLDADITVLADVRALWAQDLEGKAIGAVVDPHAMRHYPEQPFHQRWGLPEGAYFNAGILLIDLDAVRAGSLFSKAMRFVAEHDHGLPYNDQDALNWVFWGQWRKLDPAWNAQRPHTVYWERLADDMALKGAPRIVHYTGAEKPWLRSGDHPWAWLYWESLAHTPFFHAVASAQGFGWAQRLKLWLRWLKRRPRGLGLESEGVRALLR